jgi:RNA polymerase sigma factor (TIGR02999 family)
MPEEVTQLLHQWKAGDSGALDRLTPLIYDELRRLASSYIRREKAGHTLQPTALLHEAYMRLAGQDQQNWRDRSHFFGVAAHLMRLILVDHARSKLREKRGGEAAHVSLDEALDASPQKSRLLIDLDEALGELASFDARKAQVIEMRFFAGMTIEETAEALQIGVATVGREQRSAEAWLNVYLKSSPTPIRIHDVIDSAQN